MLNELVEFRLGEVSEMDGLMERIASYEQNGVPLVTLTGSLQDWEKIEVSLRVLRSTNISAILLLSGVQEKLSDEQLVYVFSFLRTWDQMLLHNFIEICHCWIPENYANLLRTEAKIELKWFAEWLTANADSRLSRYPSLPWRSFIRKITKENYDFATNFLEVVRPLEGGEVDQQLVQEKLHSFLEEKKKVVCIFPKRWGRA